MTEFSINECRLYDGTGTPARLCSVLIRSDRISDVSAHPFSHCASIDAAGLALCPGFIDAHSHSDYSLEIEPQAASRLMQGITTEVVGNCGYSPAPIHPTRAQLLKDSFGPRGEWLSWTWHSVGEYLDRLRSNKTATNVVFLAGHGALRIAAMGFEQRPATTPELQAMKRMLQQALDEGAFGMSSGLAYAPGLYAPTEELVELGRILARNSRVYASHVRNEGTLFERGVAEAITIGRRSGAPVQISHVKLLGKRNWGRADRILNMLDAGVRDGVDVTADFYPYEAGSTALSAFLPPFAHEGGRDGLLARLRDPQGRQELAQAFETGCDNWWNPAVELGWENLIISSCPRRPEITGRSVEQLAGSGCPVQSALSLLDECEAMVDVVAFGANLADHAVIASHPLTMVGSDGLALAPEGPTGQGLPHPRSFGTFPRAIRLFVREGSLKLEQMILKMTSMAADRFGLSGRGVIRPGYAADLVLFDPDVITDRAAYDAPFQFPAGIRAVWVNGRAAVTDGQLTGQRAGTVLTP